MKVAVVGHIEWASFATVDHLPVSGEIVHSTGYWQEAGGGGSVAALQLAELADECLFFTSVGNDENGRKALEALRSKGVTVHASTHSTLPTRQVFVHIDKQHERAITVVGELVKPSGTDASLPWHELASVDAVYFTNGDPAALQAARQTGVLVSTARVLPILQQADVPLDALVHSLHDPGESYKAGDISSAPKLVVSTDGVNGGDTNTGLHYAAEEVDAQDLQDTYGCGDSFAAGLALGLGKGLSVEESLKLAAHCGALAAQRRGAFQIVPK